METRDFAYFVERPRTIENLLQPHLFVQEREYRIVKTIELGIIDYENFITDMLADRQFIEECCAVFAGRSLAMSSDSVDAAAGYWSCRRAAVMSAGQRTMQIKTHLRI